MSKILVLLAEGFEEVEFTSIVDILRRGGMKVVIAGLGDNLDTVKGAHSIYIQPDVTLTEIMDDDFTMVVLPGGEPGTTNLGKDKNVAKILKKINNSRGYLAAICSAPSVLANQGLLNDKIATSYPSVSDKIKKVAKYSENRVVVDGRIITSRGPGTSLDFGITLLKVLAGEARAKEVASSMLI